MSLNITVQAYGPVFDGRAEAELAKAADEWEKNLATVGASMVRTNLNAVLRRQTPYYRLRVEAAKDGPGWKIWDQGVIYGPWLEGVGSRNRTTRFKGYATFRRTAMQIDARAVQVGQPIVTRYVERMNGGS